MENWDAEDLKAYSLDKKMVNLPLAGLSVGAFEFSGGADSKDEKVPYYRTHK